jgi:predicted dehydrogenase
MKKFRMGIIGAGIFAEANIYPSLSLHFFDDVERAAVCDLNSERADRLTDKYGWKKTYTDYHKMIEKEYLDAVIIAIGAKAHPKIASDVLRLGLPIFLEKPVSIDIEGALQILDASKETGNIVQVDHQKRHGLAWNKAREIVSNTEEFGNIVQIESKQHGFTVFPTFYTCMLEWQSHNLDLIQSFGGEIEEVEAWSHLVNDKHGSLIAMLRFKNDILATLGWGTFGGPGPYDEKVEVISDKGKGVIVTNSRVVTYYDKKIGKTWTSNWDPVSENQSHVFNGYVGGLRNFIDCVKGVEGKKPVPSIEDEVQTMYWLKEIAKKANIDIKWDAVSSGL